LRHDVSSSTLNARKTKPNKNFRPPQNTKHNTCPVHLCYVGLFLMPHPLCTLHKKIFRRLLRFLQSIKPSSPLPPRQQQQQQNMHCLTTADTSSVVIRTVTVRRFAVRSLPVFVSGGCGTVICSTAERNIGILSQRFHSACTCVLTRGAVRPSCVCQRLQSVDKRASSAAARSEHNVLCAMQSHRLAMLGKTVGKFCCKLKTCNIGPRKKPNYSLAFYARHILNPRSSTL